MPKLRHRLSMSLDGYAAGPAQSVDHPLGIGGKRLQEGGTTCTFVTRGVPAALEQARRAAKGKDVSLAGGASAARQCLGAGERVFDNVGEMEALTLVRTVAAPGVTHFKFARR